MLAMERLSRAARPGAANPIHRADSFRVSSISRIFVLIVLIQESGESVSVSHVDRSRIWPSREIATILILVPPRSIPIPYPILFVLEDRPSPNRVNLQTPFLHLLSSRRINWINNEPSVLRDCAQAQLTGRRIPALVSISARIFSCCPSIPFGKTKDAWRSLPPKGCPASSPPPIRNRP